VHDGVEGIALAQTLPAPLNLGFEDGNPGDVPPGWHVPKSISGFSARISTDGKQLQRVGLVPDIEVKPTIEGIRQSRDEVLERALEYAQTGH
jgi:hypothetical protein